MEYTQIYFKMGRKSSSKDQNEYQAKMLLIQGGFSNYLVYFVMFYPQFPFLIHKEKIG